MTPEVMNWLHIKEVYEAELKTSPTATGVFDPNTEKGIKRWSDLKKRVVEHVRYLLLLVLQACSFQKQTGHLHKGNEVSAFGGYTTMLTCAFHLHIVQNVDCRESF